MTDPIFFDSDCFSSFIWVKREDILLNLYSGKIVIPEPVLKEISNPTIPHIRDKAQELIRGGQITTSEILINSEEYKYYYELTSQSQPGAKIIGKGEASALSLARVYKATIASNNLSDVVSYVKKHKLKHITTAYILVKACKDGIISETKGNDIWKGMIDRNRKMPCSSFSDFLKQCKLK